MGKIKRFLILYNAWSAVGTDLRVRPYGRNADVQRAHTQVRPPCGIYSQRTSVSDAGSSASSNTVSPPPRTGV